MVATQRTRPDPCSEGGEGADKDDVEPLYGSRDGTGGDRALH